MPDRPAMAQITLRLPQRLLDAVDDLTDIARWEVALFADCQDYYTGGRSAVIRVLLELAIKSFKAKRKTLTACPKCKPT